MIPAMEFFRPQTLDEALALLAEHGARARVIAGGTDLIPGLQQGSARLRDIKILIDISQIAALKKIERADQHIQIGAGVTFSELLKSAIVQNHLSLLAKAAASLGSVQIRNRATIGGNFCNNAPCADSVPPLLVYEAQLRICSQHQERIVPLQDFLLRPYRTQLQPDELVAEIILPVLPEGYRGEFYKLGRRRAVAISRITLALLIKIGEQTIQDIRIASGAVTPIGIRFHELESEARGQSPSDELFRNLAARLGEAILDKTGLRWSSAYKLPVVQQVFYQTFSKVGILTG